MDSDYQVAIKVRMYGCNLNLMKLLLIENLDKVGASMYGNEPSPSVAPPSQTSRLREAGIRARTAAA
jgi:hypothetical protein